MAAVEDLIAQHQGKLAGFMQEAKLQAGSITRALPDVVSEMAFEKIDLGRLQSKLSRLVDLQASVAETRRTLAELMASISE